MPGTRPGMTKLSRHPELAAARRRWNADAIIRVLVKLVAQRADRDAENVCGVRPVTEAVLQGLEDEFALNIGHRPADKSRMLRALMFAVLASYQARLRCERLVVVVPLVH